RYCPRPFRTLPSLPTRRSSDLPLGDSAHRSWIRNAVDAFILARLERKGLRPAPAADRHTLIRRLCFDLTGLPPTPEQIDAFVARSEEHTSELQSLTNLVCRLLL